MFTDIWFKDIYDNRFTTKFKLFGFNVEMDTKNPDFFNSEASPWLLTMQEASIEFGMLQLIDAYRREFLEGLPVEIDIP